MTFTTQQQVLDALPGRIKRFYKPTIIVGVNVFSRYVSSWRNTSGVPEQGSIPPVGSGEVPTSDTPGALPIVKVAAGNSLVLGKIRLNALAGSGQPATICLLDRLVHTSGLSSATTAVQTVNTVPITRGNAKGVLLFLESYASASSGTNITYTITYTNQDGVTGRTTSVTSDTNAFAAGHFALIPLAPGDTGVQSVQSVQLSAAVASAGDFGVTLARLISMPSHRGNVDHRLLDERRDWIDLGLPSIADDAALFFASTFYQSDPVVMDLHIIEG